MDARKTSAAISTFASVAFLLNAGLMCAQAQSPAATGATVAIDDKAIGGVVTSRFGPEAGVWVIAETKDLGTRFVKAVVTDERGR